MLRLIITFLFIISSKFIFAQIKEASLNYEINYINNGIECSYSIIKDYNKNVIIRTVPLKYRANIKISPSKIVTNNSTSKIKIIYSDDYFKSLNSETPRLNLVIFTNYRQFFLTPSLSINYINRIEEANKNFNSSPNPFLCFSIDIGVRRFNNIYIGLRGEYNLLSMKDYYKYSILAYQFNIGFFINKTESKFLTSIGLGGEKISIMYNNSFQKLKYNGILNYSLRQSFFVYQSLAVFVEFKKRLFMDRYSLNISSGINFGFSYFFSYAY